MRSCQDFRGTQEAVSQNSKHVQTRTPGWVGAPVNPYFGKVSILSESFLRWASESPLPVAGPFPVQRVREVQRGEKLDQVQTPSATKSWFPANCLPWCCVDANGDNEKGLCVGLLGLL